MRTYNTEDLSRIRYDENHQSHWDLLMATAGCYQMAPHAFPTRNTDEGVKLSSEDPLDKYNVIGNI